MLSLLLIVMDNAFTFRVNGTPRPQPRPRFVNGRVVSTASAKARLWRHAMMQELERTLKLLPCRAPLFHDPLRVVMQFTFGPCNMARLPGQAHTQRPDSDNLAKGCLDVMQQAAIYVDDSQVAELHVTKVWGHRPGVAVIVSPAALPRAPDVARGDNAPPAWLTRS